MRGRAGEHGRRGAGRGRRPRPARAGARRARAPACRRRRPRWRRRTAGARRRRSRARRRGGVANSVEPSTSTPNQRTDGSAARNASTESPRPQPRSITSAPRAARRRAPATRRSARTCGDVSVGIEGRRSARRSAPGRRRSDNGPDPNASIPSPEDPGARRGGSPVPGGLHHIVGRRRCGEVLLGGRGVWRDQHAGRRARRDVGRRMRAAACRTRTPSSGRVLGFGIATRHACRSAEAGRRAGELCPRVRTALGFRRRPRSARQPIQAQVDRHDGDQDDRDAAHADRPPSSPQGAGRDRQTQPASPRPLRRAQTIAAVGAR